MPARSTSVSGCTISSARGPCTAISAYRDDVLTANASPIPWMPALMWAKSFAMEDAFTTSMKWSLVNRYTSRSSTNVPSSVVKAEYCA